VSDLIGMFHAKQHNSQEAQEIRETENTMY